jgi:hypothetical protein
LNKEIIMKRWSAVLCAAAIGLVASSQAQASYRVVKASWGQCLVWNYGAGKPWGKVTVMSKAKKDFPGALKSHGYLVKRQYCAF